eukprot:TRINITY_DN6192_c0_g1_i1.p1 TRINITY_DN6192_c0_g1~~TRINITY_DN6192_c0_g1_i1.p1  ORF type:complete len:760 (+),score=161.35 TRINITY_DN6192_c0_g1_i1:84-2282(+)
MAAVAAARAALWAVLCCAAAPQPPHYSACEDPIMGSDPIPTEWYASDYRGCQTHTVSGKLCQNWTAQVPHYHAANRPGPGSTSGIGNHNYCRNPDHEPTIWCYTTDPAVPWEYCIPLVRCDQQVCKLNDGDDVQCNWPSCHPGVGCTTKAKADGTWCNDKDPATEHDKCVSGVCKGDDLCDAVLFCPEPKDACHKQGTCSGGICQDDVVEDGTPCDDNNPDTQDDKCAQGYCAGSITCNGEECKPQHCSVVQCGVGGQCLDAEPAPDGTPCSDNNPVTTDDKCVKGLLGMSSCRGHCGGNDEGCPNEYGMRALLEGDGDCDHDADCWPSGLVCGNNNCGKFRTSVGWLTGSAKGWDTQDDCCEKPNGNCTGVTCKGRCGKALTGSANDPWNTCTCQCDPGCTIRGNCCDHYHTDCNTTAEVKRTCSCAHSCGDVAVDGCGCGCSAACKNFRGADGKDLCCSDYEQMCTMPVRTSCDCEGHCGGLHPTCRCRCDAVCRRCTTPGEITTESEYNELDCRECCAGPSPSPALRTHATGTAFDRCPVVGARLAKCTCKGFCFPWAADCGECMCDKACVQFKDCCPDFQDTCSIKAGSCRLRCGDMTDGDDCNCDRDCVKIKDCCPDYQMYCDEDSANGANGVDVHDDAALPVLHQGEEDSGVGATFAVVLVFLAAFAFFVLLRRHGYLAWVPCPDACPLWLGGRRQPQRSYRNVHGGRSGRVTDPTAEGGDDDSEG